MNQQHVTDLITALLQQPPAAANSPITRRLLERESHLRKCKIFQGFDDVGELADRDRTRHAAPIEHLPRVVTGDQR